VVVALHGLATVKRRTKEQHTMAACKMKKNLHHSMPYPAMH
jgi:hypothetical protein